MGGQFHLTTTANQMTYYVTTEGTGGCTKEAMVFRRLKEQTILSIKNKVVAVILVMSCAISPGTSHATVDRPWEETEPDGSCYSDPVCVKLMRKQLAQDRELDRRAQQEFARAPVWTFIKRTVLVILIFGSVIWGYLLLIQLFSGSRKPEDQAEGEHAKPIPSQNQESLGEQAVAVQRVDQVAPKPFVLPKVPSRKFVCSCGAKLFAASDFRGVIVCFNCGKAHSFNPPK